jgi:hypothetical protein
VPKPSARPNPSDAGGGVWQAYDEWNSALAAVVYTPESAHQPVYLDVEDELLARIGKRLGITAEPSALADQLCTAVRQTLVLGDTSDWGSVFSRHRERLDVWHGRMLRRGASVDDPPPVLALLAVFARAAELMEHDEEFRATAYYPRLAQILSIPAADRKRMENSFRRESERFWLGLNNWLAALDGQIGLPTAEAIGHRYVGIPLSQALITAADRRKLRHFFAETDLEPGLRLTSEDMARLLGRWIQTVSASAKLKKLWRSSAGREVVTDTAILELERWDGTLDVGQTGEKVSHSLLLTARITKRLNAKRLRLGFALRGHSGGTDGLPREWVIESAPEQPLVRLGPISDRLLAPEFVEDVDAESLLTGELKARPQEPSNRPAMASRRPQPLVVMSYIDEAGQYVEVDRVRMLQPHLLLVNTKAKRLTGPHGMDFERLLAEVAEEGFSKDADLPGLPDGWVLYRDVTVVRSHTRDEAILEPLKPAQTSTLIVTGGLRLPGHAVRWHVDVPLTVKGSAPSASDLHLELRSSDSDETVSTWGGPADEITASTRALSLQPGTYRAELTAHVGRKTHRSITTLALVDSDEPRIRTAYEPVAYVLADALGALTASPVADGEAVSPVVGSRTARPSSKTGPEPVWWSAEPVAYGTRTLTAPPAVDSCAVTGSHYWEIEVHRTGMKRNRGVCRRCGRVRLYSPKGKQKHDTSPQPPAQARLRHLDFGHGTSKISGVTLMDALTWLGGGTDAELARVVRQVHDSALTVDEIVRVLEALGHIAVVRDKASFDIVRWEMSPRSIAGLSDGSWLIVGAWSKSDIAALPEVAADYGARVETDENDWIPRRVVRDLDERGARGLAEDMAAVVLPDAGRRLLALLPPLQDALEGLGTVSAEGFYDVEWFDANQARWVYVQSANAPGAYRKRTGFVSEYFIRGEADVATGTIRRGDWSLVKHLACTGRPLVGYDEGARRLYVPLGAYLPGLYGRALCLLNGRPPARVEGKSLIAYADVDLDAATALVSLLKGWS